MVEDVFEIVGTVVGSAYNVEKVVAEGGFAVVYRAYHGAFKAPVALKCLKVPNIRRSGQREFLERFREEGELMFRLSMSIPSVLRPLHIDAFETASGIFVPYMALEWLEGESLDALVARRMREGLGPMSPKRVVRLLAPVARALERAHNFPGPDGAVSIVHRDLKPDNIVVATVNGEEVVKILDFGIAKVKSVATQAVGRQSHDGTGAVPFTPGYAAPEQWFPKRYGQTGPWTDIWGLALCAVEAMSGRAAIDGDHAAMMGTAVDEQRRPTPRTEGVRVSDEVERVFLRAIAIDPRDRYQDVGRFWDDLEAAVGVESSRSARYSPAPRSDGPPAMLQECIETPDPSPRRSRGVRVAGTAPMSTEQRNRATPAERLFNEKLPPVASVPDTLVPDLATMPPPAGPGGMVLPAPFDLDSDHLELDISQLVREEAAPALAPHRSKPAPHVLSSPSDGPSTAAKASNAPAAAAQASSAPPAQLALSSPATEPDAGHPVAGESSGIDLAVLPQDLRRASSTGMRAARPTPPPAPMRSSSTSIKAGKPSADLATSGAHDVLSRSSVGRLVRSDAPLSAEAPSTARRLALPISFAVLGLGLALAYYINASIGGGRWALGPVPVNWIAALFALSGTGWLLLRLFLPDEE
jgi:serine/threonine-protein kinase